MAACDLLSVGLTVLDILGRPVEEIPAGGDVGLIEEIRLTPAGTAAAPAMVAAKLGLRSRLLAAVGNDELGEVVRRRLVELGVDISLLQAVGDLRTSATILPVRPNGDRPALHAPGASLMLAFDSADTDDLLDTRFLHLGGVGVLPCIDGAPSADLLRRAKERGVTVTCDLIAPSAGTLAALEQVLPHVDYFMPTLDEALQISERRSMADAAGFFFDRGAPVCIFKHGAQGAFLVTREATTAIPAYRVEVVDTSGCGDSFCGGFIAALANGLDREQACRFASATAALVATGLGSDAGVTSFSHTLDAMNEMRPLV